MNYQDRPRLVIEYEKRQRRRLSNAARARELPKMHAILGITVVNGRYCIDGKPVSQ